MNIATTTQFLYQILPKFFTPSQLSKLCRRFSTSTERAQQPEVANDASHQHSFTQIQKYNGETVVSKNLPAVTRILSRTRPAESELMLLAWKKKMIEKLGEEGFNRMQEATLRAGSRCHSAIEQFCKGVSLENISVDKTWLGLWKSVQSILPHITEVSATEGKIIHPHLKYYGYADCVAKYKGEVCLIDWKTSQKRRYSLKDCYDDPIQVAAYAGAFNCSLEPDNQITSGLVVKIYHDGQPATPFLMNELTMEYYWRQWTQRLAAYNDLMKNKAP